MKIKISALVVILFCTLALVLPAQAGPRQQGNNTVLVLEVKGAVTPAMYSYLERGVEAGEAQQVAAVLVLLDTPGGAIDTTQKIIQLFRNANVPVIVYVSPAGAQAASAGSLITLAAHAAVMAPETVIGAASPVSGDGADIGDTLYRKVVEDLKATVRGLAARRGPEAVSLAEQMIEDARAVSSGEALEAGLIDAVSSDLTAALEALDGHAVTVNGQSRRLALASARPEDLPMSPLEGVLHALSNPLIVGILLTLAVPAILIELKSPGGWVAGFTGVVSLALALYGLGQLPVNWFGLVLIALAFVLFLMEVQAPGFSGLALVGGVTLLAGLLVLFNSPGSPEFARISLMGALTLSLLSSGLFLFAATVAVRAMRAQPQTGREGLVGATGRVRKSLVPAPSGDLVFEGKVIVHGELWHARAGEAIPTDAEILVTATEGFVLHVAPVHPVT